jgi:hypothetical protein
MMKPLRALFFLAALVPFAGTPLIARADAPPPATYGTNLVVNGDAETDVGAPDNDHIVKPTGWATTGQFTAVQYGASGGFPDKSSAGPDNRGLNLFEGGNVPKSTAQQTIALGALSADIDAGTVSYNFSAWIGGWENQGDYAVVSVQFRNTSGATLATSTLGPVTPAQRPGTSLVQRSHSGAVPKGTRSAVVSIVITRLVGTYNDGSVDNIALVLNKKGRKPKL